MLVPPEHEDRLKALTKAFLEQNAKVNLSAFRTEETVWNGNVLDSLPGLDVLPDNTQSVLDLGTGGGFPLLPLSICSPERKFTGLDSTQKKIDAIWRILDSIEQFNVKLLCARIEDLGQDPEHREQYDIVTARALAPLNVLLEYAVPFLKVGGQFIAWKSMKIDQEIQESLEIRSVLSCHHVKTHRYDLGGDWGTRQLLVFEKTAITPKEFPRSVGIPKKNPIL